MGRFDVLDEIRLLDPDRDSRRIMHRRPEASRLSIGAAILVLGLAVAASSEDSDAGLPDPLAAGWKGQSVCELLREGAQLRVLRCSFAPGVGHERHFHAPHWGYALAGGRMRLTDAAGWRDVDISSGASWHSAGVEWHEVLNIGETTAICLLVEPK